MKTFVIVLASLVGAALIAGGIFLLYQGRSASGLSIDFIHPERVTVAEPFSLEVNIENASSHVLEDVALIIELPEGMVFAGSVEEKNISTKQLGNVGVGSLTRESFELIALRGENTILPVKAAVTYRTASLQSVFEKEAVTEIPVQGSVVLFDLTLPEKVFSGETFASVLAYENSGTMDLQSLELEMVFPAGYAFVSATIPPDSGSRVWELGDLRKGSKGELEIKGGMSGPDNAFFEFGAILTAEFNGRRYTIAEKTGSVAIQASPLSLVVQLENQPDKVVYPGEVLRYAVRLVNTSDIGFKDVIVRARLVGELFDIPTLASNASLQASNNTLIWNAGNTAGLGLLQPGDERAVFFDIRTKGSYPIQKLNDKDFTLRVEAEVESPTTPYFVDAKKTLTVAEHLAKVGGRIAIDARGLFRDAASGILNKGPWPMKVGQKTQFTVHWVITNYATDVTGVSVRSFLGGNVEVVGEPKSSISSAPVYNKNTQEITWDIADIAATKGVLGSPVEAIFQVEVSPSVVNANQEMVLLKATEIRATDAFTGETLTATDGPVSTNGLDDPTVKAGEGTVMQ